LTPLDTSGRSEGPGLGDRIEIRGLRADARHGVSEGEQAVTQPFEVDLDLYLPLSDAAVADELGATADYAWALQAVSGVLLGPPRRLLETLAEEMAAAVLAGGQVTAVTVTLRKLRPPVPGQLGSAGVRITRHRH
jgi:7,8-dihydroneopterin aldolase/epimerase/oxygenase